MYYDARQEGDPVNLDDYDFVASPPIARFIQPEADCYAALERCQGSILPFCLGSYEVRARFQEIHEAHPLIRLGPLLMRLVPARKWPSLDLTSPRIR